jgi:hypothetical protein
VAVLALALTLYFRYSESAAKSTDEHVNRLIEDKLQPATKDINANIDKQLVPVNDKLSQLLQEVGELQGRFKQLDSGQKKLGNRIAQQESLSKLLDPNRILATIRAEIQFAEKEDRPLPASDLADYKNAVLAVHPSSAVEYWTTVAAIINYQSMLNQMSGEAPDPKEVSRPCLGVTNGGGDISFGNTFRGGLISNCIVDLDRESFSDVTFKNSVIRYNGGPTKLANVTFVNCTFILNIKAQDISTPESRNLLLALLNSPDQKEVRISTHS